MSEVAGVEPYIVAEVVAESPAAAGRDVSIASALAGARSTIWTRDELMEEAFTRRALSAWDAHDDVQFDRETTAMQAEPSEFPTNIRYLRPRDRKASTPGR